MILVTNESNTHLANAAFNISKGLSRRSLRSWFCGILLIISIAERQCSAQQLAPPENGGEQAALSYATSFISDSAPLPEAPLPRTSLVSMNESWQPRDFQEPKQEDDEVTITKMPSRFFTDEWHVLSSPARIRTNDLRWLIPLAGATAAAFATDTKTMRDVVSHNPSFNDANSTTSDVLRGAAIGIPVLLFGAGQIKGDRRSRETGLLGGEAMVDAYVFDEALKYVTLRERPSVDNARGRFFIGSASSDPSFISGHSVVAWSSAAVLAGEYSKPWQQGLIYTLASGVSLTRVLGQQHFPSDVLLGSAAGWLIGHYVYRSHHRKQKM